MSLAAAFKAKNWRMLVNQEIGGRPFTNAMNDNYIMGAVKFIVQKLNVPNMMVIDEKKQIIYYHLMHQSSMRKAKLNTLDNFIKLTTTDLLTAPNTSSYY